MLIFNYSTNDEVEIEDIEDTTIFFNEDLLNTQQNILLNNLNLSWYYIINGKYYNMLSGSKEDIEEALWILSD